MLKYFLFSALLSIYSLEFSAQVSLDEGLLLHYKLDGSATDAGPNNLNGVPNVSYTNDYMSNQLSAALFDGASTYIDFPNVSVLKPELPITVAFRVKLNDSSVQNSWVLSTNYSANSYRGVFVNTSENKIQFSFGDGDEGVTNETSRRTKTGTKPLEIGQWHHVVGVIRGATDMDIYVDCVNEGGTYSGTGGPMSYDNSPGSIGRGDVAGASPYYLDGSLDDFRYWNRALSASEVQDLCNLIAANRELEAKEFESVIYPNPTRNIVHVSLNGIQSKKPINATLSDASGRVVYEANFNLGSESPLISLDLSQFEAGFYYLSLMNNDFKSLNKILKQ